MPPNANEKSALLQEQPVASLEDPQPNEGATLWELRTLLIPYFWPKSWGLRLRVVISFSFLFLSRGSRILAPLFLKEATNVLSESQLTRIPVFSIGMYCATLFVFAAAKQLQTYLFMVVKQHAYQDVAAKLFGHLHSLSMNYHLTKKTGKVLRCLDRGSSSTDNIVNVLFFRLLPTFVELVVVSIVFIFSFKEKILSVVTIIGVVLYIVITAVGTRIRLRFKKQTNEHDNQASEKAVDSLVNFETVKYFCTEDYELARYMTSIFLFQKSQLSTRGLMNAIVVAQQVIQQSCLGTCLLITARNIFRGTMTIGDFVAVTVYISNIYRPLDSLGNIYNTIVQSFVDMENLVELLRIQPEVQDKPGAPALEVSTNASTVSFHNVCFRYSSQPVANGLKDVSFTVPTGKTVAIVGSTGSGKTTTSRLLFRFYDVVSGKICINGQDITSVRQKSLRQCIGIVPQDTVMFNDSIRYNLTYGRRHCTEEELVAAVKVAKIYDFIMSLPKQFDSQIGERGLKLSGGEKQRIAIARLVLKNPSVVVLDEATSSLDTVTEQSIHEALNVACEGRTTIIIAHRLSTVRHADNIIVLEKGSVIESGSHSQLIAQQGRTSPIHAVCLCCLYDVLTNVLPNDRLSGTLGAAIS
ncbi:hypothetical protein BBI17_004970 [Phytophthora kernoviae]|uniref:ABC transporter n=2 Tax=Phytophthora kernoviae TaxID=325452 RepID=A0A3R7MKW2_9STRA|nr:hypothetical protein G195_005976 [Phytophthora kernoviae 00238/432]KAG2525482.1 hypothetical protein JM18_003557 [Phytophthora kernoviae]RLN02827.1 hypothetical protein BBI17_004970 [Phytophthora kernoviae]